MRSVLEEKRQLASAFFRKRWPNYASAYADDFGSFCVEQWLTGRNPETSLKLMSIDFLRKFNRTRFLSGEPNQCDAMLSGRIVPILPDDDQEFTPQDLIDFEIILKEALLTERERVILVLIHRWGFNQLEVANAFGLAGPTIHFLRIAAQKKVKLLLDEMNIFNETR